jgi:hypothetical protein
MRATSAWENVPAEYCVVDTIVSLRHEGRKEEVVALIG